MILPDTNLLIYAYNKDDPRCRDSALWWSECLSGSEPVVLCFLTLFAFVRITTSARAFPRPLTVKAVSDHITEWLEQPNVQVVEMETGDIMTALDLLRRVGTAGNLTTDAQIAASSLRLGATIHTADSDYSRFPEVRWHNPLVSRH